MPYQLPIITTLLLINLICSKEINQSLSLIKRNLFRSSKILDSSFNNFSIFLGYQSLFIYFAFFILILQKNDLLQKSFVLFEKFLYRKKISLKSLI